MISTADLLRMQWLYWLIGKQISNVWHKGLTVPKYKKGDEEKCEKYTGITLLSLKTLWTNSQQLIKLRN